jgi:iron(II)-dependent oxidoreductase
MLTDARARTLALIADLTDQQLMGPRLAIVNPLLWEIGHVAWFQERWVLRHLAGEAPIRSDADALFDSANIPHQHRWSISLPSRGETIAYAQKVLDRVLELTLARPLNDEEANFRFLTLFHEDMHGEAFAYTRQTLEYPCPPIGSSPWSPSELIAVAGEPLPGDVSVPGGRFRRIRVLISTMKNGRTRSRFRRFASPVPR